MTIDDACKAVHRWAELHSLASCSGSVPSGLPEEVSTIKAYLEGERADGKPIIELELTEDQLMSREGIQWIMPFVLSVESMETAKHRKARG
jgi:hypothetical protein